MRVVYKKSIIDKLVDTIAEARSSGREIEKIVLTKAEAYELQVTCSIATYPVTFDGVPIEVEGNP